MHYELKLNMEAIPCVGTLDDSIGYSRIKDIESGKFTYRDTEFCREFMKNNYTNFLEWALLKNPRTLQSLFHVGKAAFLKSTNYTLLTYPQTMAQMKGDKSTIFAKNLSIFLSRSFYNSYNYYGKELPFTVKADTKKITLDVLNKFITPLDLSFLYYLMYSKSIAKEITEKDLYPELDSKEDMLTYATKWGMKQFDGCGEMRKAISQGIKNEVLSGSEPITNIVDKIMYNLYFLSVFPMKGCNFPDYDILHKGNGPSSFLKSTMLYSFYRLKDFINGDMEWYESITESSVQAILNKQYGTDYDEGEMDEDEDGDGDEDTVETIPDGIEQFTKLFLPHLYAIKGRK